MSINLETLAKEVERKAESLYRLIDERALWNHAKVLAAFRKARVSDFHLKGSTGYGYGDSGRETLENIYMLMCFARKKPWCVARLYPAPML
jgi:cystathionine beta-lyase family protein involved in aluminum resistance